MYHDHIDSRPALHQTQIPFKDPLAQEPEDPFPSTSPAVSRALVAGPPSAARVGCAEGARFDSYSDIDIPICILVCVCVHIYTYTGTGISIGVSCMSKLIYTHRERNENSNKQCPILGLERAV